MKKSLLIALVGIVFFALTSCNGESKPKESKEFSDAKAYIEKYVKAFTDATSCDEIEALSEQMETEAWTLATQNYEENEKMTEVEEKALTKIAENWVEVIQKKVDELGCEDVDEDVVEEAVVEEVTVEEE